jgi:hypothetical protein
MDNHLSDLALTDEDAPTGVSAEGSDQGAAEFTTASTSRITHASKLDEFALDVMLTQCSKSDEGER